MVEAARTSQPPGAGAKPITYRDLQVAATVRARALLASFETAKKTDPRPQQLEEMAAASNILKMMDFRVCSDRIAVLAAKPQNEYNVDAETKRMCVALYLVKTLEKVREAAIRNGDSASYALFIQAFVSARKALSVDYFFYDDDTDLVKRFMEAQPSFDACAKAFGTVSYECSIEGINQLMAEFLFPLGRLMEDVLRQKKQ